MAKTQTRPTRRKALILANYHKKHSLLDTAIRYDIQGPDHKPSTGLVAFLIGGGEPKNENTRIRCHLPPKIPKEKRLDPNKLLSNWKSLNDLPDRIILLSLIYRKDM